MLSSLQRELEELFEAIDAPQATVTASALSQARAKLRHTAFIELNEFVLRHFYEHCPDVRRWNGYIVTAVDGSTAALPRLKALEETFGGMKPHKGAFRPKARVLERYDVLNHLVWQAQLEPYAKGERSLWEAHHQWEQQVQLPLQSSEVITLYDRGFASLKLLNHHAREGTAFVLRLPARWWKIAQSFLQSGAAEQPFNLQVREQSFALRLVRVQLPHEAEAAVLVTNLLDSERFSVASLRELYGLRWGVENGYKLLKCRAELEHWSSKSEEGIRQDFHAKIMALTLSAALNAPLQAQLQEAAQPSHPQPKGPHPVQVNRTHALAAVRRWLPRIILLAAHGCAKTLAAFQACLKRALSVIRPGRSAPRPAYVRRMPPTAYKTL